MKKKKIKIEDKNIECLMKVSKRAKRMRLAVYCDGSLVVTKPQNIRNDAVENFIKQKSDWILSKLEYFKKFGNSKIAQNDEDQFLKYQNDALKFVERRVKYFNSTYKIKYNKINIKNQKTRWGSCSKKGNLNFNYKIVLLPKKVADYIIVHEMCHLIEFNHSQKFWNLVRKTIPNFGDIKRELKNIN